MNESVSAPHRMHPLDCTRWQWTYLCYSGGACSCWRNNFRSPVETESTEGQTSVHSNGSALHRGVPTRRSRESGYESCTPVSPLRGPDELASANVSMTNANVSITNANVSMTNANVSNNSDLELRLSFGSTGQWSSTDVLHALRN